MDTITIFLREWGWLGLAHASVFFFGVRQTHEFFVPLSLQTIHDQAVLRTSQQVLALCQFGFFASTFYLGAAQTIHFRLSCSQLLKNLQRHIQGSGSDGFEHDFADCLIDLGARQALADGAAVWIPCRWQT